MSQSFGSLLLLTYLWGYLMIALMILIGSEKTCSKVRLLLFGLFIPAHFLVMLVAARTVAFFWYIMGRMRGMYKPLQRRLSTGGGERG